MGILGSRRRSIVNPLPPTSTSIPGRYLRIASRSPVFQEPLMNWTTLTGSSLPAARSARPNAAVLFPFPFPVKTRSSPRRRALASRRLTLSSSSNNHLRGCGIRRLVESDPLVEIGQGQSTRQPVPMDSRQVSWLPAFAFPDYLPRPSYEGPVALDVRARPGRRLQWRDRSGI